MKLHVLTLAVAAGAMLVGAPQSMRAQDGRPKPARSAAVRESGGEVAKRASQLDSLFAAMDGAPRTANRIRSIETIASSQIITVDVQSLAKGGDSAKLDEALQRDHDGIETMRQTVQKNVLLRFVLGKLAPPIAPQEIVAATLDDEGCLTVYFKK